MYVFVDVYNASYVLQGEGPITNVLAPTITRRLDGPGKIRFGGLMADARLLDLADLERRVTLQYDQPVTDANGNVTMARRVLGRGIIQQQRANVSDSRAEILLSGPDQLDELRRKNTWTFREYEQELLADVVEDLVGLVPGSWTVHTDDIPEHTIDARFDGVPVLSALRELAKKFNLHFRLEDDRELTFGPLGDQADVWLVQAGHTMLQETENAGVALIDKLTVVDTSEDIINRVLPLGSGEGKAALTLEHSTRGSDIVSSIVTFNPDAGPTGNIGINGTGVTGTFVWQTFTITSTVWVDHWTQKLKGVGSPTGTLTSGIYNTSGSAPTTLVQSYATGTAAESGVDTADWEDVAFHPSSGFYLTAGTYAVVVTTDRGVDASNHILWGLNNAVDYTGGGHGYGTVWGTWTTGTVDLLFAINTIEYSRQDNALVEHLLGNQDKVVPVNKNTGVVGPADLSGATITATNEKYLHEIEDAFDGDLGTYWSANEGVSAADVEIDNGATSVAAIGYRFLGNIKDYTLYYWDGAAWQVQDTQTGNDTVLQWVEVLFGSTRTAAKWKLEITDCVGSFQAKMTECQLLVTGGVTRVAQSFVVNGEARVVELMVALSRVGVTRGNAQLTIQGDSGNAPDGTAIPNATVTFADSTVDKGAVQKIVADMTFTPFVDDATTYWLVIGHVAGAAASDYLVAACDASYGLADSAGKMQFDGVWSPLDGDLICGVYAYAIEAPYVIKSMAGPDGDTLYYLEHEASVAAYGAIEKVAKVDVSPLSNTLASRARAADVLYDAAAGFLDRMAVKQTAYRCAVAGVRGTILPGQKQRLTYKGYIYDEDGNKVSWRDINTDFWVVEVTERPQRNQAQLVISDVFKPLEDVATKLVRMAEMVEIREIKVRPREATFTYVYTDFVQQAANVGSPGGTWTFGKNALFRVRIDEAITEIQNVMIFVRTKPLYTLTKYDTISASPNMLYSYGVIQGSNYPANISMLINGVNVDTEYSGPWKTGSLENSEWTAEFDITEKIINAGVYGEHTIEFSCDQRTGTTVNNDYVQVPGYTAQRSPEGSSGLVELTVRVFGTAQPIKVG